MGKKWLIALGVATIWGGGVVAIAQFGSPSVRQKQAARHSPVAAARAPHVERSQGSAPRTENPNVELIKPVAHVAEAPQGRRGVAARQEHIARLPDFQAFAKRASLKQDEEKTISRVLALHYENEAALEATADPEKLSQLKLRLIGDTVAQLRVRMKEPAWDAFVRSGLLVGIAPAKRGT